MKTPGAFLPLLVLISTAGALRAQTTPAATPLTLRQAVATALEKNPSLQAAEAYAQAVEQGIAAARAGRYPRLDFSEGFTRGNNPVYVFGTLLTQRQFTAQNFGLNVLNAPTPLDNFRTAFTAALPLYDAGRTSRRIQDARLEARGARESSARTRQEIIFQVIQAYLNELLAREGVRVAESAAATAKADLDRAQARQQQGLAVPSDVLSMSVQSAQAQEDLIRARNALAVAQAGLDVAMGLPEDSPHELEGTLEAGEFEAGTLAERQARALQVRPDYLRAAFERDRAENGVTLARRDFLPRLDLFSSWETDNQTFAARGGNNWAFGATLSLNLFDGGANRARLAASHARGRQAEAELSQMASTVRLQVREAYLNLDAARQRLEVTRQAAAQAGESLRILQDRYDTGLATMTDLLRAETMRTVAEKNQLNARADYRLAYAALELATGELAPDSPAVTK